MCTTLQYVRRCPHPATHRFRDNLCKYPNGPTCRITDREVVLPVSCNKCQARKRARYKGEQPTAHQLEWTGSEADFNDIWYVPARCFIDVGYSNLNPFGNSAAGSRAASQSSSTSASPTGSDSACNHARLGVAGTVVDGQTNPWAEQPVGACCVRERRNGYFATTRLESWDNRVEGRIWDNRCSSQL